MHIHLADHYRSGASWLHRLDPRAKMVMVVVFITGVGLAPVGAWPALTCFLAMLILAVVSAGLGWTYTLRRSFVALPFVLAALSLPFTVPGEPVFTVPILGWTASLPGTIRFASVVLRTWLAIQAAILLAATTSFPDILWALSALRVPAPLVAIVGFMYRYLFLAGDEALHMMRARTARSASSTGGGSPSIVWQGRVTGNMVGSLFLRSIERSERVYDAMVSRGYDGEIRSLIPFHFHRLDAVALAGAIVLTAALLVWSFGM
ncbi:MAG TPA: cobalt ECF transporter T component CbiQ [Anaerolineales bacterium]|nr:cobalt ECF transporter T component CbiQ [Anaerolineales bacterium]